MRIRATVAAVTGALALSALAVPAAHAAAAPDLTFTKVTVNKGKPIVARASGTTSVPVMYTFKHARGLDIRPGRLATLPFLYVGRFADLDLEKVRLHADDSGTCTATSSTVASCKGVINLRTSGEDRLFNTDARKWNVGAIAVTDRDDLKSQGDLGIAQIQFHSKLSTTDATPEPVAAGATITVKGALTRANWKTHKYEGYVNAPVALQFQKKGTTAFTTVKTIRAGAAGALKTTVTASVDGTYRYAFAGSTTTAPVTAAGDYVDVK
ncbi:lipoprotein [Streptomyces sp. NRRL WC-3618]|uniref:hypothetical protein n=1 Tax=Streptomyces sp. NRRL WC-3618 TaxID=1519490 RepID=UPI0006AE88CF|nr:hypothetical protein [Streptomyces sp. NRRL WC-3618]KOV59676.1 lipoprotein [Streptomyces sp. NRRL WC-3618]